jgi:hypothetical protein
MVMLIPKVVINGLIFIFATSNPLVNPTLSAASSPRRMAGTTDIFA